MKNVSGPKEIVTEPAEKAWSGKPKMVISTETTLPLAQGRRFLTIPLLKLFRGERDFLGTRFWPYQQGTFNGLTLLFFKNFVLFPT